MGFELLDTILEGNEEIIDDEFEDGFEEDSEVFAEMDLMLEEAMRNHLISVVCESTTIPNNVKVQNISQLTEASFERDHIERFIEESIDPIMKLNGSFNNIFDLGGEEDAVAVPLPVYETAMALSLAKNGELMSIEEADEEIEDELEKEEDLALDEDEDEDEENEDLEESMSLGLIDDILQESDDLVLDDEDEDELDLEDLEDDEDEDEEDEETTNVKLEGEIISIPTVLISNLSNIYERYSLTPTQQNEALIEAADALITYGVENIKPSIEDISDTFAIYESLRRNYDGIPRYDNVAEFLAPINESDLDYKVTKAYAAARVGAGALSETISTVFEGFEWNGLKVGAAGISAIDMFLNEGDILSESSILNENRVTDAWKKRFGKEERAKKAEIKAEEKKAKKAKAQAKKVPSAKNKKKAENAEKKLFGKKSAFKKWRAKARKKIADSKIGAAGKAAGRKIKGAASATNSKLGISRRAKAAGSWTAGKVGKVGKKGKIGAAAGVTATAAALAATMIWRKHKNTDKEKGADEAIRELKAQMRKADDPKTKASIKKKIGDWEERKKKYAASKRRKNS